MRAVVQRVKKASVHINNQSVSAIDEGLLVYLGVGEEDDTSDIGYMAKKLSRLRIFADEEQKMNQSILDHGFSILLISQFTLFGDARRGNRPSFTKACEPIRAEMLYLELKEELESLGICVQTGVFQTDMQVSSINDGPVTLLLDSRKFF